MIYSRLKLVLDTTIVVAALRSPKGASATLVRQLESGTGTFLLNVALALEYDAVCHRPEHQVAAGLSRWEIDVFVDTLIGMAVPIESHFRWRPVLRDPGDEMVVEAAVNGAADAIVTFNTKDYVPVPELFGIEILLPGEAVRRMRQ